MKKVALSSAKAKLSELIDEVRTGGESIVIQKRNKEVVVLVEMEHFQRMQGLEDHFRSVQLRNALAGKTYPLREVLAELDPGL